MILDAGHPERAGPILRKRVIAAIRRERQLEYILILLVGQFLAVVQ